METGSVGSMTSYLASPYMALCLLAVLGFYPFVCKASVVCVDCSGPGCEHPGSCETNGKCFLRRDVNGLLYRGCADNQRWEGLDLGYNGCRWQHYLGWDNARVLWCLCHKPNCNSVTVGIFMLRDYSIHVLRPTHNADQSSRDHQAFTKPEAGNGGPAQRGNVTMYHRNHTHTHRGEEWSTDSASENWDEKQQGRNGEFESESTQIEVDENGDRGCNISRIICKILGREYTKDNAGSSDGDSVTSSTAATIASDKNNEKDSGSEEAQNRESSDGRSSDNPEDVSDSQDDKKYEHASTTESTMHGTISVEETEDMLSLGDQREGERNQTSKDSGTASEGNSDSGLGNAYGARYDMDLDYEADYADRMEDDGEGSENRELGSPQDGGAKKNNKDYRWLVNTDGSEPYEPIGPIEGLDDLDSHPGEPLLGGTGASEQESDSSKPQTGVGATQDTFPPREPLPDGLQTGDSGGDKWWGEGTRDGPAPLDSQERVRQGPQPLNNQEGVQEGSQPLNNQEGVREAPQPLNNQEGVREGSQPLNNQEGVREGSQPLNNQEGVQEAPQPLNNQEGIQEGSQPLNNQEGVREGPQPLNNQEGVREGPQPLNNQEGVQEGSQPLNNQEGVRDGSVPVDSEGGDREGPVPLSSQVPTVTSTASDAMLSSSTRHPQQTHAKCPSEFKVVPHLHSCYHVDRAPQTWQGAADHCTRLDPRAHLVTVDRPGEYQYIVLKVAMEPKLMRGWQGWWTSGRYDVKIREFTWANTGHVISRLDPKWRHGLIVSPYSGTCVWFVPLAGFKIGNYGCQQPAGAICEIDL